MQRGLISLSHTEIAVLLPLLENVSGVDLFKTKLNAALQENSPESSIEVSADELESTLDSLALPSPGDSADLKQLRQKISQKLFTFRSQ